ncbi:MAG: DNA polymerase III subunit delta' [Pirellulaceae bacterium]|nr:DNA polymerase III subunit delta' [Pirellulaceae bacterium]
MPWQEIEGHDAVVEQFRRALERGRMASSFLFVGPSGIGKRTFALALARTLLCQTRPESAMDPCGRCESCVQVTAGTHPDLLQVAKPKDKSFLPLELLIGDKEHRMREGLCHDIGLKPYMAGRRVAIIDDADYLNAEGANSLLKTLEEPPPRSVLILVGTSPARQLPTIRSRCQLIRFQPLPEPIVARLLLTQGHASDAAEAARLAAHAEGSPERALELADPALWEFREKLLADLAAPSLDGLRVASAVSAFVDEAGRDAPPRRARLRLIVGFAAEFYRRWLLVREGAEPPSDATLARAIRQAVNGPVRTEGSIAACAERCLDALEQIDRNANQTTLIECWIDDLDRAAGGDF